MSAHASHSDFSAAATATHVPLQTRIAFRIHAAMPWLLIPIEVPSQVALEPVLAPVPNVKSWLRGVLNLRGNLVPVFDIAAACGFAISDLQSSTVLVLEPANNPIGFLCIESPQIALGRPAQASLIPDSLEVLRNFVVPPMQLESGLAYEFRFRAWTAHYGRLLPGATQAPASTQREPQ